MRVLSCKSNKVLLNSGSHVNANDRWQFTPLHEAAQKGRTQLCSLLLAHGADPYVKNQEGQTPFQVSGQEDVRCLLRFEYKFVVFQISLLRILNLFRDAMLQCQSETSAREEVIPGPTTSRGLKIKFIFLILLSNGHLHKKF